MTRVTRGHAVVAAMVSWLLINVGCVDRGVEETEERSSELGTVSVLTRNYGNDRAGANVSETVLNTGNVATSTFGKLFELAVDDQIYAGTLYAPNVSIAGGTHNVVYVATVNNSVYAFDADTGGSPLWQVNFNNGFRPPFHTEVGSNCGAYSDMSGNMGIVGTPVIDGAAGTLYVVTRTVENSTWIQRLRALNITTGAESTAPQVIGTIDPMTNNQRAALALSAGKVYVAWASHCDTGPYNGRMLVFDAGTLAQLGAFNTTPGGSQGGIWMSGAGPIIDASGNVFAPTGNGTSNPANNQFAEAILKLSPTLTPLDYFMPSNYDTLNADDEDLGSAGPIVVPGTNLLVMGGKGGGNCYLVNMNNLGHVVTNDTQIPQKWHCGDPDNIRPGDTHHFHNAMVAWNSPAGLNLYTWSENDFGRAWRFNGSTFNIPATSISNVLPPLGMPGGLMTLSANGSTTGTGVLWVVMPLSGDANQADVPGILRAFDAEDLTHELWNSTMLPADSSKTLSKGSIPMVANGRVYLGSVSQVVNVYGLRTGGGCVAETDAAFCSRLGKNCGTLSGADNCGAARTVASCGACTAPGTCSANVCLPGAMDLTEGGTASGTGVACTATETVAQAYDDLMTSAAFSKWCVGSAPSSAVPISTVYDFVGSTAQVVTSYALTTANDVGDRDPRDWTLQGCQGTCTVGSDTGWITLDTRTGQFAGAARYQTNTYVISNSTAYQQYRLRVTANNGNTTTFQIAELQLFGAGASCTAETDAGFCSRLGKNCGTLSGTDNCGAARTVASCGACTGGAICTANVCGALGATDLTEGGTPSGTGVACAATETVAQAYDDLMTSAAFSKWCVGSAPSSAVPISTVYDFVGSTAQVVTSYALTTANDVGNRDPRDWTLQGCQGTCTVGSDTGWITLDTRTGQFANAARYQTNSYAISNSTAYQQYRLRVTANNGNTTTFQIAELQLFGAGAACTAETDAAFCGRLGQNCGTVSGTDNCGAARTVASCGACTAPATCGGGGTANVCGTLACTPETDPDFCSRLGQNCGTVSGTDNCGAARTVASCGACTAPATCGGGGTANVCGTPACTPETDPDFCSRLGQNCGTVSGTDNCGAARTVASCGACTAPAACGGGGIANVCGTPACTPETDPGFCGRLGQNCGTVSGTDNCGAARTVAACGACTAPATCGGGGTANVCGAPACTPETDPGFCSRLGKNCGTLSGTDNCGAARTVASCGACTGGAICTANVCGALGATDLTEGGTPSGTGVACAATETVAQAYDDLMTSAAFSKWCVGSAPSSAVPISTVYDFVGSTAQVVTSYALTTANDVGNRDPRDWTLQGCQGTCTVGSDTGWITLDTRTGQFANAARYQTNSYAISNSTAYQQYRLRVTANNGNTTTFQIAELQLFGAGAACTAETDAAFCGRLGQNCGTVSGTDNCGAARTVASCGACTAPATCGGGGTANVCGTPACTPETDPDFCSRLGQNCGTVSGTDNCGAARTVASCGACTAPATCGGGGTANVCGTPACTPETDASFCLRLVQNCGSVSGTDNCGAARTVAACGTCTAPQTCGGSGIANVCGAPGSFEVTEGGAGSGTGTPCVATESPTQAYDDQSSTKWCVASAPTTAVPISTMYDFSGTSTYTVTSYTVTTANDAPDRDPKDWTLQGCQGSCAVGADAGWVVLDTRTGQFANANPFQTNTYQVTNATGYQQYRLRVTANNGNTTTFQVAEIQLFGTAGPCIPETDAAFCAGMNDNCGQVSGTDNCGAARAVTSCGTCTSPQTCGGGGTVNVCAIPAAADVAQNGTATGTGTACTAAETVAKAYDNQSSTKWCVASAPTSANPISTMYDFAGTTSYIVTAYTVTTANDQSNRDPKDWVFQGCQGTCTAASDTGWTTLDTRTGQFSGAARFQTNTYQVTNATAYQQYRLRVTANNGNTTTFQVAEIQMAGPAGP